MFTATFAGDMIILNMDISLYKKEYYTNSYLVKIAAYYLKNWDNFKMSFHTHSRMEIMYVSKGKCTIEVLDEKFVLSSGDLIFIDANVSHRIIMDDTEHCRMLNIEFLFVPSDEKLSFGMLVGKEFVSSGMFSDKKDYIIFKDDANIYSYLNMLVAELESKSSDRIVGMQTAQILIKLSEMYDSLYSQKRGTPYVYVNRAISYIGTHYQDDIKAETIAKHCGVNKNYLQRRFKQQTGNTLVEYINTVRIEKAKQLLEKTDIPIIDLCFYVGINSRQYFTSLFKKHTGTTPIRYRSGFLHSSW